MRTAIHFKDGRINRTQITVYVTLHDDGDVKEMYENEGENQCHGLKDEFRLAKSQIEKLRRSGPFATSARVSKAGNLLISAN
jgi:hypothetical protein